MQIRGYHLLFFCKSVSRQAKRTNWPSFDEMKVMEYSYDFSERDRNINEYVN